MIYRWCQGNECWVKLNIVNIWHPCVNRISMYIEKNHFGKFHCIWKTPWIKERLHTCKRGCNMIEDGNLICCASSYSYATRMCFGYWNFFWIWFSLPRLRHNKSPAIIISAIITRLLLQENNELTLRSHFSYPKFILGYKIPTFSSKSHINIDKTVLSFADIALDNWIMFSVISIIYCNHVDEKLSDIRDIHTHL